MIRNIPGDIYKAADDCLLVTYYDAASSTAREEKYDLVVLSIGITPSPDLNRMVELFDMGLDETGFVYDARQGQSSSVPGVFAAGTVSGPMSIAESVASAAQAVVAVTTYLQQKNTSPSVQAESRDA